MAEQKFDGQDIGSFNKIADGLFSFKNVNSNMMFDVPGSSKESGAKIQQYTANGTAAQKFIVKDLKNGYYSMQNQGSGLVLDIAGSSNANGGPLQQWAWNGTDAQQFAFEEVQGKKGIYTIRVKCSGKVLDVPGSSTEEGAKIQQYESNGTDAQKFYVLPQNYKLKAAISDFDFGDQKEVQRALEDNKKVSFIDKKTITANEVGITAKGSYGKSVQDSFSYGFTETIGVGVETEVSCGVPMLAEAKVKVSASFSFAANQQVTTTNTQDFSQGYDFAPQKTGIYEVGMTVYCTQNQKMPFTAKVVIIATSDDGNDTQYSGAQTVSILRFSQFNCKIVKVNEKSVEAKISGNMTADFCVSCDMWNKRVGDV